MSKCPNLKCQHEDIGHFIDADDEMHGSCWATPTCDCDWNPHDIRQHDLTAQLATVTAERDALKAEVKTFQAMMEDCEAGGDKARTERDEAREGWEYARLTSRQWQDAFNQLKFETQVTIRNATGGNDGR